MATLSAIRPLRSWDTEQGYINLFKNQQGELYAHVQIAAGKITLISEENILTPVAIETLLSYSRHTPTTSDETIMPQIKPQIYAGDDGKLQLCFIVVLDSFIT